MATEARAGVPAAPFAMPWLGTALGDALRTVRGHAVLIHGPSGAGQFELSMQLASAWLCEASASSAAATASPACGRCAGCRLVAAHSHPDLLVLLPEVLRESLGWAQPREGAETPAEGSGKAKPSKEIKVGEMRAAIAFAQTTAARGRAKAIVVYPAERINDIAANALLKTLEEPPGEARIVLACTAPDSLLPTVRSRCQAFALRLPDGSAAAAWLRDQRIAEPAAELAAAGGQPQEVLARHADGINAAAWLAFPGQIARGESQALGTWPLPRLLDALLKLCHDLMRAAAGSTPRFFAASALPMQPRLDCLAAWQHDLLRAAEQLDHPLIPALLLDGLVARGQQAIGANAGAAATALRPRGGASGASVHSAR